MANSDHVSMSAVTVSVFTAWTLTTGGKWEVVKRAVKMVLMGHASTEGGNERQQGRASQSTFSGASSGVAALSAIRLAGREAGCHARQSCVANQACEQDAYFHFCTTGARRRSFLLLPELMSYCSSIPPRHLPMCSSLSITEVL